MLINFKHKEIKTTHSISTIYLKINNKQIKKLLPTEKEPPPVP